MIRLCVITLALLVALDASAAEFNGKVVRVRWRRHTGCPGREVERKIRLQGIDAPEKNQAFNSLAKKALSDLTFGKQVRVAWKSRDKYDRVSWKRLCRQRVGESDIGW